jgi:hypothetical protein
MFNKRGQELSTGTIILLIIGVIILVLLALGFTSGWGDLGSFLSQNNVDTIRSKCNSVCVEGGVEDYCVVPRNLYPTNVSEKITGATCYYLSQLDKYGIESCGISCSSLVYINETTFDKEMDSNQLVSSCQNKSGITLQYLIKEKRSSRFVSYRCA